VLGNLNGQVGNRIELSRAVHRGKPPRSGPRDYEQGSHASYAIRLLHGIIAPSVLTRRESSIAPPLNVSERRKTK
jgi:hypothetical protein